MASLDDKQARVALERLRRTIAVVLGTLALLALLATFADLWPAPAIDRLALDWFGRASLRTRIVGVFCTYGLVLLAALLPVLLVQRLLRRNAR